MKHLCSLFGLVAVIAACGDDTGGTGSGSGGSAAGSGGRSSEGSGGAPGTTTSDAATTTSSSSASTASSSTGEGPGPGPGAGGGGGEGTGGGQTADGPQGDIRVGAYRVSEDSPVLDVYGTFDAEPRCTVLASEGGCVLSRCLFDPGRNLDAGTIGLVGGDIDDVLEFPDYELLNDGEPVVTGDVVNASSEGADTPAFELSAVFPERVSVVEPSFEAGTIVAGEGLMVVWTPGGAGQIAVLVTEGADFEDPDFDEVRCEVPMAYGEVLVPGGLLEQMETTGQVTLSVQELASDVVTLDDWTLTLHLTRYADAENGIAGDAFQFYDLQ